MRGEREQFVQAASSSAPRCNSTPSQRRWGSVRGARQPARPHGRSATRSPTGRRAAVAGLRAAAGSGPLSACRRPRVMRRQRFCSPPGPPPGGTSLGLFEADFAADDQLYLVLPRRLPGPYDTGQAAFVGDRQGPIAQARCTGEEFRGAGGAALEAEVGQAMQFGVGAHANQPCSHSGPSLPTSR